MPTLTETGASFAVSPYVWKVLGNEVPFTYRYLNNNLCLIGQFGPNLASAIADGNGYLKCIVIAGKRYGERTFKDSEHEIPNAIQWINDFTAGKVAA